MQSCLCVELTVSCATVRVVASMCRIDWQDFKVSKFSFKHSDTTSDLFAALGMDEEEEEDNQAARHGGGGDEGEEDPFAAGLGVSTHDLSKALSASDVDADDLTAQSTFPCDHAVVGIHRVAANSSSLLFRLGLLSS